MKCPTCQRQTYVIDSRELPDKQVRRRRYVCDACEGRFSTYEITAAQFKKVRALEINVDQFDATIAALRSIKAQFGEANEHDKD